MQKFSLAKTAINSANGLNKTPKISACALVGSPVMKGRKRRRKPFTVREDLSILEKAAKLTSLKWETLAGQHNRSVSGYSGRWHHEIKPAMLALSKLSGSSFENIVLENISKLKSLDQSAISTILDIDLDKSWTPELDKQLIWVVGKLGIDNIGLATYDFPQFSSTELQLRYDHLCPRRKFSPEDDLKILKAMELYKDSKGRSRIAKYIHDEILPEHGPRRIACRIKLIEHFGVNLLTDDDTDYISRKVAEEGREFFCFPDERLKQFEMKELLRQWAFLEPVDQKNAIWPEAVDIQLVRSKRKLGRFARLEYFADYYESELAARYFFLETTSNEILKRRFDQACSDIST